jgi:hypothetical protein
MLVSIDEDFELEVELATIEEELMLCGIIVEGLVKESSNVED